MIGRLRVIIRGVVLVSTMLFYLTAYSLSLVFKPHDARRAFRLRRMWINMAIGVLGIRIENDGKPTDKVALYVSNHRTFTDPMITAKFLDAFIIAKAEVRRMPIIHWGAKVTGVIYVNRENRESRKAARGEMLNTLQSGYNVLVYPEGTVGAGPSTMEFKTGTFKEAASFNIPVVPIAIEYKSELDLWENRSFSAQLFRQVGKPITRVRIRFGQPIQTDDPEKLLEYSKNFIDLNLAQMQSGWSEKYG